MRRSDLFSPSRESASEDNMLSTAQSQRPLSTQLAEVKLKLDAASEKARTLVNGLSSQQMTKRPQQNQWSVAECLVHLNITSREYLPILSAAFEHAPKETSVKRQFKMDFMGRLLKWTLEPPPKFRVKTTVKFEPLDVEPVYEVLPTFLSLQEQLKASVESADGLALDKVKVTSPFNSRVKYNLLSCFNILLAHERRHLWQAERVRNLTIGAFA
jgi:hypothetical protein